MMSNKYTAHYFGTPPIFFLIPEVESSIKFAGRIKTKKVKTCPACMHPHSKTLAICYLLAAERQRSLKLMSEVIIFITAFCPSLVLQRSLFVALFHLLLCADLHRLG